MITRRAADSARQAGSSDSLILPFDMRSRSRFRARLASGAEVGVILEERGQVLRDGDCLQCADGRIIVVRAAEETVTTVCSDSAAALARIAYHLGNRHVPLQIGDGWLRYSHDHVLDDMVIGLGARLAVGQLPFEPENGAYHGSGAHRHPHDSLHGHSHDHGHDHRHDAGRPPA